MLCCYCHCSTAVVVAVDCQCPAGFPLVLLVNVCALGPTHSNQKTTSAVLSGDEYERVAV